jgi:outer membrane scaffolding protein for murein synthesis (MipA/OmpV family)
MRSRLLAKKTLAAALTSNWLIIMASLAGATLTTASVHAADENYTTSAQDAKGSKWSAVVGGGGAHAPDHEGADDYELQPFPSSRSFMTISSSSTALRSAVNLNDRSSQITR